MTALLRFPHLNSTLNRVLTAELDCDGSVTHTKHVLYVCHIIQHNVKRAVSPYEIQKGIGRAHDGFSAVLRVFFLCHSARMND